MESPNKSAQPCPGPSKSARSRVETLRDRREQLREEMKRASARLAEAEAKAERLARIQAKQNDLREREQLGTLSKRFGGLDRYRLAASNPDTPAPLDTHLIAGALSWLAQQLAVLSPEDQDVIRKKGAAMVEEMQMKGDANAIRDVHLPALNKGDIEPPLTFDLPE